MLRQLIHPPANVERGRRANAGACSHATAAEELTGTMTVAILVMPEICRVAHLQRLR